MEVKDQIQQQNKEVIAVQQPRYMERPCQKNDQEFYHRLELANKFATMGIQSELSTRVKSASTATSRRYVSQTKSSRINKINNLYQNYDRMSNLSPQVQLPKMTPAQIQNNIFANSQYPYNKDMAISRVLPKQMKSSIAQSSQNRMKNRRSSRSGQINQQQKQEENFFKFDLSPRGIPVSMNILKETSLESVAARPNSTDRSEKAQIDKLAHQLSPVATPRTAVPKARRKMPMSGPFSIAHNKLKHVMSSVDDIDQDKVLEGLYLDCLENNMLAMRLLNSGNPRACFEKLRSAESTLVACSQVRLPKGAELKLFSLTLNNFGCYYKKQNKPNAALKYLNAALNLEKTDRTITKVELAGTYLNLCAIYSGLDRHFEAVKNACRAIALVKKQLAREKVEKQPNATVISDLLSSSAQSIDSKQFQFIKKQGTEKQQDVLEQITKSYIAEAECEDELDGESLEKDKEQKLPLDISEAVKQNNKKQTDGEKDESNSVIAQAISQSNLNQQDISNRNTYSTFAAAFYNLGVSFEYLKKYDFALQAFQKGRKICFQHLPDGQTLIESLQESIEAVQQKKAKIHTSNFLRSLMRQNKTKSGAQSRATTHRLQGSFNRTYELASIDDLSPETRSILGCLTPPSPTISPDQSTLQASRKYNNSDYSQQDISAMQTLAVSKQGKMTPNQKTQIFGTYVKNEMKLYSQNRNCQEKNIFNQINDITKEKRKQRKSYETRIISSGTGSFDKNDIKLSEGFRNLQNRVQTQQKPRARAAQFTPKSQYRNVSPQSRIGIRFKTIHPVSTSMHAKQGEYANFNFLNSQQDVDSKLNMTSDKSQQPMSPIMSANPKNFVSLEHNTYPMSQGNLNPAQKPTRPEGKEQLEAQERFKQRTDINHRKPNTAVAGRRRIVGASVNTISRQTKPIIERPEAIQTTKQSNILTEDEAATALPYKIGGGINSIGMELAQRPRCAQSMTGDSKPVSDKDNSGNTCSYSNAETKQQQVKPNLTTEKLSQPQLSENESIHMPMIHNTQIQLQAHAVGIEAQYSQIGSVNGSQKIEGQSDCNTPGTINKRNTMPDPVVSQGSIGMRGNQRYGAQKSKFDPTQNQQDPFLESQKFI